MKENKSPLVSVCVITYQHGKFIKQCLEGILSQITSFDFEILLGEDGSSDGTREICVDFANQYPDKIRLYLHDRDELDPKNGALRAALNCINNLQQAKGKYIALCEGDDYWTDLNKLQKQVDFLEKNPDYVICYHDARIVDEEGNSLSDSKLPDYLKRDFTSEELMKGAWILTLSMCFRNVLQSFPEELFKVLNGDIFLIVLLGKYGKGKYLGDIQPAVYRKQSGSIWSSLNSEDQSFHSINSLLYIYQYLIRTADKSLAIAFLFENVFPLFQDFHPNSNPFSIQLAYKEAQLQKKNEQLSDLYNSATYKVGNLILWPINKLKYLIWKIKN